MKCANTKTLGQGMTVSCGDKEWGEDSNTFYCESCLRKMIKEAFIDGALCTGTGETAANIFFDNSEYKEFT